MNIERRHIKGRNRAASSRKLPRFDIRSIREEVEIGSLVVRSLDARRKTRVVQESVRPSFVVRDIGRDLH